MAEEKLAGRPVDPEALRREIAPVFAKREGFGEMYVIEKEKG